MKNVKVQENQDNAKIKEILDTEEKNLERDMLRNNMEIYKKI